jgi:SPP1 gp7 family putative phage head morphogenesis protein
VKKLKLGTNKKIETILKRYINKLLTRARKRTQKELLDSLDLEKLIADYKANLEAIAKEEDIKGFLSILSNRILEQLKINVGQNPKKEKEIIRQFIERVELLITTLLQDEYKELQRILSNAIVEGKSIPDIAKEIKEVFSMDNIRAEAIAITETANINSQLNRARMKEANISKAIWSSARDKRVRRCHLARDGKTFEIEKGCYSGCDGRYIQVGQEVRCRCAMVIVVP